MKKALITGISGQDGSYLAEHLLEKGYKVYGFVRRVAHSDPAERFSRIQSILDDIELVYGTLENYPSIYKAVADTHPDEIYHLAAQSFVSVSFFDEFSTLQSNVNGTHFFLAALKELAPQCKFYFAASSEMFGKVRETPQTEKTPFHPRSVYGISKVTGFDLTQYYREAFDIFACNGILYNHESPRRGMEFVTRKITSHVAQIKLGLTDKLELGNLDAKRDWGHARDYVKAMWMMLQHQVPDDYIVCRGETCSVKEFCQKAFEYVGLNYEDYVVVNPKFFRSAEVDLLLGDCSKAKSVLGWEPESTLDSLIAEMMDHDLQLYSKKC